jgi:nucleotide-binding universal stress UspA family protein
MSWLPKKTVVVPVDFSDDSLAAVRTAREMVAAPSDLRVLHVLPDLTPLEPSDAWHSLDDSGRIEQSRHTLRERLAKEHKVELPVEILVGDAGHSIANYAADVHADLIVMPSHGRTGLARMLIGSVAERVVRLAHCPVLVLRK